MKIYLTGGEKRGIRMNISFKKFSLLTLTMVLATTLAACSSGAGSAENEAKPNVQQDAGGPLTKYDPPIKLTSTMNETGKESLAQGDTHANNIWTRGYKDELGIDVTYEWIVPDANYNDKMNVTLASGDLP